MVLNTSISFPQNKQFCLYSKNKKYKILQFAILNIFFVLQLKMGIQIDLEDCFQTKFHRQ